MPERPRTSFANRDERACRLCDVPSLAGNAALASFGMYPAAGRNPRLVRRSNPACCWWDTRPSSSRLIIRGDGHYGRPEVKAWCEANGIDYIFGLAGNAVVDRLVEPVADDVRVRRAEAEAPVARRYCETRYGAKSWRCERRVAARIEATTQGLDIRYA
jgi:hypothetical protein